jgi:hypothetical protein
VTRTAYAASQAAACRPRRHELAGPASPEAADTEPTGQAGITAADPLETCAAVARLGTSSDALPELTALLAEATGGPVTIVARADLTRRSDPFVLPIDGGRGGAVVLQPTVPAWSDPTSPALIVLARLLDQGSAAGRSGETEKVACALLDGFEAERRELAERLHRGVLQSLIGSRYLFDLARSAEGRSALEALGMAREAVQEALAEGRALLRDVTPRVGDRSSLQEEAGLLPGATVTASGTAPLSPVVAATAYRLLQALSRAGEPVAVSFVDVGARLRLTIDRLTDCDGRADRGPSATGAGSVLDGLAPDLDRLRLIGVRVVEDGQQIVLDLPVAPRLPVQRTYRAVGRQPTDPTTSTTAQRPKQPAPRRSEGNP